MFDVEKQKNIVDRECRNCPCLTTRKKGQDCLLNHTSGCTVCTDDVSGAFDTPQEAINYFAGLKRAEFKNSKNACKQPCLCENDCFAPIFAYYELP